ncbi:hypothetical protein [Pseudomonas monsensis]|uniref:radical SAM protein n=1 Tax=Pseudomonas monsensis TaxID=2745509 RepID=UPI00300F637B
MYIDIVGACNLSCPSCPMGNSENLNFKKAMQLDMFKQIVDKAKTEGVDTIYLDNWTEPLIHPKIGEFIEIINAAGMGSGISTNLNLAKNMEKALMAEPSYLRISLSCFLPGDLRKGPCRRRYRSCKTKHDRPAGDQTALGSENPCGCLLSPLPG